jgi:hypothetical protein
MAFGDSPRDYEDMKVSIERQTECDRVGHPHAKKIGSCAINVDLYQCPDCGAIYTQRISVTRVIRRVRGESNSGRLEAVAG